MATKTIQTRIKNRFDTLSEWNKSGVTLLPGEIALVSVTTQQTDPVTGDVVNVPAVLMKVGESDGNGGTKSFSALPWVSALAADIHGWAKNATAEEVPVTITVGGTPTLDTLGGWIKSINDKAATNASNISANTSAITTLNGSDTTTGSVAKAIKDAIEALDVTTSSGTGNFVKAVTQTNGKISVTKGTIAEVDLPSISSDKITIGTGTTDGTLSKKLSTMEAAIAANTSKLAGHTDTAINTLIDTKINALDVSAPSASGTGTAFITSVSQTDGKISATKASLPTAGDSTAGITKLYTTVGASTDGTVTRKVVNDINTKVETNKADIASLKTAITNGVHFIGITTTDVTTTTNKTNTNVTINSETVAANQGDIVIYSTREFIWDGSKWEELGDVTRIGNLETKINNLDVTTTNTVTTTHKFVSQVTQTDGKIEVTYTQPTSADVSHTEGTAATTVKTTLEAHAAAIANKANSADVYTKSQTNDAISTAISNLDFTAPTASGNTTSFIDSVSQTDGKITATKKTITPASTSAAGIVKLNNTVSSTSATEAATAYAVKTAYDKGADGVAAAAAIADNYIKITNDNLVNQAGAVIIFDCGGAADF